MNTNRSYVVLSVPGQRFRREDEKVIARAALHDSQVGNGQITLADDLVAQFADGSGFGRILRLILGTVRTIRAQKSFQTKYN